MERQQRYSVPVGVVTLVSRLCGGARPPRRTGVIGLRTLTPQVESDHLQKLIGPTRPLHAVVELIWNGLDADAGRVEVEIDRTDMDAVDRVVVADDGDGMTPEECARYFERLGGSWKPQQRQTRSETRVLHGSDGKGRYRAFALGRKVKWVTVALTAKGRRVRSIILGGEDQPGGFLVTEPHEAEEVDEPTGTRFEADPPQDRLGALLSEGAVHELTKRFAPYLRQYPGVAIVYDGHTLDPEAFVERRHEAEVEAQDDDGQALHASLELVEWSQHVGGDTILLCDQDGFALDEEPARVRQRGFAFTIYLSSSAFEEIGVETLDAGAELHPRVRPLLDAARNEVRDYLRRRAREQSEGVVEDWKRSGIYPYEGEPRSPIERQEREVFDAFATELNDHLPSFRDQSEQEKKLALHLMRRTLESSPSELVDLLDDVLDLSTESQRQLRELLRRASLESLIKASRIVIGRIDFMAALERLLFDPQLRKEVTERGQLHELVAANTWLFGEQYHLAISERGLTELLRKHADQASLDVHIAGEPVKKADGGSGRVDLMLSGQIGMGERLENLVVELKRPSQTITSREIDQVRDYAIAVAKDDRFAHTDTRWEFWLVGTDLDDNAQVQVDSGDRPLGLVGNYRPNIHLWVKTWAQVLRACRFNLDLYRRELGITYDGDEGLAHLKRHYPEFLPASLLNDSEEPGESQTA